MEAPTTDLGDTLRDSALDAIRHGLLGSASFLLLQARRLHHADPNRLAALEMVEARIEYERKNYTKAAQLHAKAHAMWNKIGDTANPEWVRNNRFHWLLAAVRVGDRSEAYRLSGDILRDEPIERRRRLVQLTDRYGRPAVVVYEFAERLYWRFGGQLKHSATQ